MASPYGGNSAAASGVKYSPVVMPVWKSLEPGSQFLEQLFSRNRPPSSKHHLLFGYRISQAIYVAAKLRIADVLKDGPQRSDELATRVAAANATAEKLQRLRVMVPPVVVTPARPGPISPHT